MSDTAKNTIALPALRVTFKETYEDGSYAKWDHVFTLTEAGGMIHSVLQSKNIKVLKVVQEITYRFEE